MTVAAGDSITVTIWQIKAPHEWAITLNDNTSGENFHYTDTDYVGPHTAAEYALADAAVPLVPCPGKLSKAAPAPVCTLGAYSPAVAFTNLHTIGTDTSIAAVLLVQQGVQVSTPSINTSDGFTVAYGSIVPSAP
jgi:hypothetical protein